MTLGNIRANGERTLDAWCGSEAWFAMAAACSSVPPHLTSSAPRLAFIEEQSKLHPEGFGYMPQRDDSGVALA